MIEGFAAPPLSGIIDQFTFEQASAIFTGLRRRMVFFCYTFSKLLAAKPQLPDYGLEPQIASRWVKLRFSRAVTARQFCRPRPNIERNAAAVRHSAIQLGEMGHPERGSPKSGKPGPPYQLTAEILKYKIGKVLPSAERAKSAALREIVERRPSRSPARSTAPPEARKAFGCRDEHFLRAESPGRRQRHRGPDARTFSGS